MENKDISKEMKRVKKLLKYVSKERQPIAQTLFKELSFMDRTLSELKKQVEEEGPTTLFRNGKQEFLKEHPALKGYNTTIQRYSLLYKQLIDLLPVSEVNKEKDKLIEFLKGA